MSYRVRNMEPRDLPSAWRLAEAQNRRDHTSYPFPDIFEMDESKPGFGLLLPNVPLALTVERDGRVRRCFVFTRTIECMGFGGGAEDMAIAAAHIPLALDFLARKGYQDAHVFVPNHTLNEAHGKLLQEHGLIRIDNRLAHFFTTM